jgi:hypothetical protein
MGSAQSSVLKETTNVLNESVVNVTNKNISQTTNTSNTTNSYFLEVLGNVINCPMSITQTQNVSSNVEAITNIANTSQLANTVNSAISQAVSSNQKSVNGFLATAFGAQSTVVNTTANLQQIVNSNLTNESFNDVVNFCQGLNTGKILIGGNLDCQGQPQIITQSFIVKQFSTLLTKAITDALMTNTSIASAASKIESTQSSKNKGIASVIGAALGGLVLVIIIAVVVVPKLSGGSKSSGGSGGLENVIKSNPELMAFRLRSRRFR